jgi:predicted  nucleic acid-binding Zn-ribbon protein
MSMWPFKNHDKEYERLQRSYNALQDLANLIWKEKDELKKRVGELDKEIESFETVANYRGNTAASSGEYKHYAITKRVEAAEEVNNKLSQRIADLLDTLHKTQEENKSIKVMAKEERDEWTAKHEKLFELNKALTYELNEARNKVLYWKSRAQKKAKRNSKE